MAVDILNISERVERGVNLLYSYAPEEWAGEIDTEILDIGCECSCVLAQLYGSYNWAIDTLIELMEGAFGDFHPSDYGFEVESTEYPANVAECHALTSTWVERVESLRG